jgi:hypothetical protein
MNGGHRLVFTPASLSQFATTALQVLIAFAFPVAR